MTSALPATMDHLVGLGPVSPFIVSRRNVQPISLGWTEPRADVIAAYGLTLPIGRYEDGASNNTGLGMLGQELLFGTTVYRTSREACTRLERRPRELSGTSWPPSRSSLFACRRCDHRRVRSAALAHAIAALDPSQREVLVLRDVDGVSAPEVAKILGVSVAAVKSRLHRARLTVRAELAPALGRPAIASPRGVLCPDVLTLFSQHLEGEIEPGVCAAMEAHVAQCPHCRADCESLKRTLAICRQWPTPEVPASLAASDKTAIHAFLNQR